MPADRPAPPAAGSSEFARLARRGLLLLTLINLLNYIDRFVLSALVESLKKPDALGIDDGQAGLLAAAFLIVYTFGSLVFGALGDKVSRPVLLAIGVAIWSVATALGGLVTSFLALFLARATVGVGEAAYGTISPSLLADYYPPERRARAFAVFFMAIPVGAALGYMLGGFMDSHYGWRSAFFVAGAPGLVLSVLALALFDPPRGVHDEPGGGAPLLVEGAHLRGGIRAFLPLFKNRSYVVTVAGYAAYTFALGGLGYWMPAFLERERGMSKSEATVQFGTVVVVTGFLGTFLGGWLGDRLLARWKNAHLWLSGLATLLAAPCVWVALTTGSRPLYMVSIVVGELLMFASTGPINSAIVNVVRPEARVAAAALGIFAIHLFGDVPSPPLIGVLSDAWSLEKAVLVVPVAIFVSGAIWTGAAWSGERRLKAAAPS